MQLGSGANRRLEKRGKHHRRWPQNDIKVALALVKEAGIDTPLVAALPALMAEPSVDELLAMKVELAQQRIDRLQRLESLGYTELLLEIEGITHEGNLCAIEILGGQVPPAFSREPAAAAIS